MGSVNIEVQMEFSLTAVLGKIGSHTNCRDKKKPEPEACVRGAEVTRPT
jgi:hypothetical protein